MSKIIKKDLIFDKEVLKKGRPIKVKIKHKDVSDVEYFVLIKSCTDIKLETIRVSEKDGKDFIEFIFINEIREGKVEIELLEKKQED